MLLQILDDGRCTDSNGRTVDFKNTIIIMTSNVGSEYILSGQDDKVMEELHKHFKPEFINRVDEVIVFKKLTKDVLYEVLDKIVREIEDRLKDSHIQIRLTDAAKNYLIDKGYDEFYGARPLKRLVNREVETVLAKKLIDNEIKPDSIVTIDYQNHQILVS